MSRSEWNTQHKKKQQQQQQQQQRENFKDKAVEVLRAETELNLADR